MTVIQRVRWSDTDQKAVHDQLDRILHSVPFQHSRRRQRFLEYIVTATLTGRSVKGYDIALEVFGRPETFDPAVDPVVRVEAGRLREKLREYYGADGQNDLIRIDLPKGTYTPQIEFRYEDGWRSARRKAPSTQEVSSTIPSVAVLPFDVLSADQNLDYLGDGVAEDIITALSRFPDSAVVARTSSFAYKGKAVDIRQVGNELGVDYVVEGSVRKDGDRLRIVSQLIDAKNGEHVWAERFDRSGTDPWALQDEVTGMIVSAMTGEQGALKQAQHRQSWGKGATTLEEYDYYLRGHDQLMKYTHEGIERSGRIWREGLAKFPSSPLLKVKLGWHHLVRAVNFVSDDPPADVRKAGELARQVLANEHLSPQVARLANWVVSHVLVRERDFDGALGAADRAVALAPYDTFMLSSLMMVLVQAGRPDQALQWADQAAARDPALGWFYNHRRGWAHLALGRFGEAVDALTQTEFNDSHVLLAIAYVRLGRSADARAEVGKMMKVNPAIRLPAWRLGYSFRDPAILDRCSLDLGKAGLPET
ncbi:adenylate/guanylate cyclase domain-containing protein [Methyloceanibacter sp.]|uniref:adenylate/guanylate cyclase domain-containing protein n=1 Tax=Methyloceanibacter sp. TaxID=1965321 RepID=UPI003D6D53EC